MDLKNLVAAFFIVIIVLTLIDIPSSTGHLILPPANSLESAGVIITISIFMIIIMLIPRKTYT